MNNIPHCGSWRVQTDIHPRTRFGILDQSTKESPDRSSISSIGRNDSSRHHLPLPRKATSRYLRHGILRRLSCSCPVPCRTPSNLSVARLPSLLVPLKGVQVMIYKGRLVWVV